MKLTNPEIIKSITKSWSGERDANSRPLVSDDILNRMKLVTTEEAWGTVSYTHLTLPTILLV